MHFPSRKIIFFVKQLLFFQNKSLEVEKVESSLGATLFLKGKITFSINIDVNLVLTIGLLVITAEKGETFLLIK